MVYSAKSDATTISQFTRYKKIHINSSPDGALTDFQIKRTISYESAMQADFDDIRFNETDGSYINYWIESKVNSSTATIWIKTNVPATGGKDIYLFYGNSSLSSNSDGRSTFIVYDRYENVTEQWTESDPNSRINIDRTVDHRVEITDLGDIDSNTYLYLDKGADIGNFIYKATVEVTAASDYASFVPIGMSDTIGSPMDTWNDGVYVFFWRGTGGGGRFYIQIRNNGSLTTAHVSWVFSHNTTYYLSLVRNGDLFRVYVYSDYARTNLIVQRASTVAGIVGLRYAYATGQRTSGTNPTRVASGNISESIIAKYTANDPTTSIGTEQHQRITPQIYYNKKVYNAKSDETTTSHFLQRKKIHINSSPDGALTDYQIKLTVPYESVMQGDFDDIRFNESDGSYINYWIESKVNSSTATMWIKTNVPATGGKDIYMYYGNSFISNNSDGRSTFIVYDRYENVTEQWTELDPNSRIEIDRTVDNRVEITQLGLGDINTYVYLDKGADIGNFIYKASVEVTALSSNFGSVTMMGVSDTVGSPFKNWNYGAYLFYYESSGNGSIFLRVCEGGGICNASIVAWTCTHNTIYYYDMIRNGDDFTVNVYSDYDRTNLLATVTRSRPGLAGLQYVYVTGQRFNYTNARHGSGNISESIIAKYTPNIPTTSVVP